MTTLGGRIEMETDRGPVDKKSSSSEEYEIVAIERGTNLPARSMRSSSMERRRTGKCECECSENCVKYWAFIVFLFLIYYALNVAFIVGIIEAVKEDSQTTLIAYGVLFLCTVFFIIGLVIWGAKTNQLEKAERIAEITEMEKKEERKQDRERKRNNKV